MKTDSSTAAKLAGLNISDRNISGLKRARKYIESSDSGDSKEFFWEYFLPDGEKLADEDRISELNALAVPPAWENVWFCTDKKGHIQATGKDGKGRLQYRYHPAWIGIKSDLKFANIDEFGLALPNLRDRVQADFEMEGMPLEKATALIVRLMDEFHIRVGSDQYAKENESYGLTTLKEGHVTFLKGEAAEGSIDAVFNFKGKSGKQWRVLIEDDNLASLIEDSGKVGGESADQDLFRYEDASGKDFDIKADHINSYISDTLDYGYTAKDFRTWAASWKTASRLAMLLRAKDEDFKLLSHLLAESTEALVADDELPMISWMGQKLKGVDKLVKLAEKNKLPGKSDKERQAAMLTVIDTVAADLGNTRAVCKSSYIRPMFMNDWESGLFEERWAKASLAPKIPGLSNDESTAFHYMRTHE